MWGTQRRSRWPWQEWGVLQEEFLAAKTSEMSLKACGEGLALKSRRIDGHFYLRRSCEKGREVRNSTGCLKEQRVSCYRSEVLYWCVVRGGLRQAPRSWRPWQAVTSDTFILLLGLCWSHARNTNLSSSWLLLPTVQIISALRQTYGRFWTGE